MAYEHYHIICKPMGAFKITLRRNAKGLLLVWLYCLFWATAPLLGWGSYGPEGVQTSCSLAWQERTWVSYSFLIPYWFFSFFLPMWMIIYCYCNILTSIRRVRMTINVKRILNVFFWRSLFLSPHVYLCIAEPECGESGRQVTAKRGQARYVHGGCHDWFLLLLLAALRYCINDCDPRAKYLHIASPCLHACSLGQDQPCIQPRHLLPGQKTGERVSKS